MDEIRVFVKVAEAGSFSTAARRLGMPKTTVSAKVAGLERRLGVRLIQRTTRKLRMTEAGERYFRHCAIAIREVELGEAALQSAMGKPSGVIKVTVPVDLGHALLPRIAHAYAVQYPDVSLELILTNRTVDLVEEGVDLAIRSGAALTDSSLIARRFFETCGHLWASPKYLRSFGNPAHPRDLAEAAFVGHSRYKSVVLTSGQSDFEVEMNGRVHSDDFEMIKAVTILGGGIGLLPDYLVGDAVATGALVRVLPQWQPKQPKGASFYFVYAGRRYALPKVEGFIKTALELVQPYDVRD
jgi:DNA-binding transcriptional LysR family regulator